MLFDLAKVAKIHKFGLDNSLSTRFTNGNMANRNGNPDMSSFGPSSLSHLLTGWSNRPNISYSAEQRARFMTLPLSAAFFFYKLVPLG